MHVTNEDYVDLLKHHGIQISMDSKGRALDNIFIERFFRSLKYELIYCLKSIAVLSEPARGKQPCLMKFARYVMFDVGQIDNHEQKSHICSMILRALPNWFGIESSIIDYIDKSQTMPFWAALDGDNPIGFAALKIHSPYAAEVYVMGILREYHRKGIGRMLIEHCESFCIDQHIEFLTVKTLDESAHSNSYAKTRQFYLAMGFRPIEVFPLIWDQDNPCLFMAKHLS